MSFQVPQFIEHEAKIIGPFTLKQFFYIGGAGVICFIIYFSASMPIFILSVVVLGIGSLALAFMKVGGRSLPTYIKNSFAFFCKPKVYLWKKKEVSATIKVVKEPSPLADKEKKPEDSVTVLKIAEKSRLKDLSVKIETKAK